MTEKRVIADRKGREGEAMAAQWLMQQGWQVVDDRVKTKLGEIDLIARKPGIVAFIEVKWRKRASDLDTAIDEHRLSRVAAAVEAVAHEYAGDGEDISIDVILLAPGSRPRHIPNAWMP
ncbi:YraN family protein [Erythrobacter aurantius]|uniref:YraN family protein n=1 Tax=Erythrobacter aurantius TaxID=2909249 RepID=UPI002079CA9C|nr:YraN family protein [Erythrobacter aurantius]